MANNKSTIKRIRQAEIARQRNKSIKTRMRTKVRELRAAVAAGDTAEAQSLLPRTTGLLDQTAQSGAIHRNSAARTKSRLEKAVASIG